MSNSTIDVHETRLREVVQQYESEGYRVRVHPDQHEFPAFLEEYQPDAIAERSGTSVVIHVASRADLEADERFSALIDTVNEQSEWRLDLVTIGEKGKADRFDLLSVENLDSRADSVSLLLEEEHWEAAFLVCWSITEALLRHLALRHEVNLEDLHPGDIVKRLYMHGAIEESQMDALIEAVQARNRLVHGFSTRVGSLPLHALMETTNALYHQYQKGARDLISEV